MKKEELMKFLNKRVKLSLKNGSFYTCKITNISDTSISFIDKYENDCLADMNEISTIFLDKEDK